MEITRLYLGSIDTSFYGLATPFNGYLIKHPRGAVMVDTGFGTTLGGADERAGTYMYGDLAMPWVRRTTVEALEDHGLEPGDVKYVINTHLNDHGADNHMFPDATFIIQRPEWDWLAKSPLRSAWDFPGVKVEFLDGEDAEVLAGVTCVFTPGHTPGHQSIIVNDSGTKTLFLGDAAYTFGLWDHPEALKEDDPWFAQQIQVSGGLESWLKSVEKLKGLEADTVHFAHTREVLHRR